MAVKVLSLKERPKAPTKLHVAIAMPHVGKNSAPSSQGCISRSFKIQGLVPTASLIQSSPAMLSRNVQL